MLNIEKHISYLKNSASEDWEISCDLIENNKIRHGLFFAHLALEKLLKALVSKKYGTDSSKDT